MVRQCIPCDGVWFAPAQLMLRSANMHRAGLGQLSRLRKLQHLSLAGCFASCTHQGLEAALATLTGGAPFTSPRDRCHSCLALPCFWLVHCEPFAVSLHTDLLNQTSAIALQSGADLEALSIVDCGFLTDRAMGAIAQCTKITALFVEEQGYYPGRDDTRWLDLRSACVWRNAPVVGVSEGCGSKPTDQVCLTSAAALGTCSRRWVPGCSVCQSPTALRTRRPMGPSEDAAWHPQCSSIAHC